MKAKKSLKTLLNIDVQNLTIEELQEINLELQKYTNTGVDINTNEALSDETYFELLRYTKKIYCLIEVLTKV